MGQNSKQDQNHFPALIAHTGTAGTAETVRVVGDSSGALNAFITGGTVNVDVVVGDLVNTQDQPYTLQVDDQATGTVYVGEAAVPGTTSESIWRIKRIVDTGGTEVVIGWAGGSATFTNVYDNRGTLSYS